MTAPKGKKNVQLDIVLSAKDTPSLAFIEQHLKPLIEKIPENVNLRFHPYSKYESVSKTKNLVS